MVGWPAMKQDGRPRGRVGTFSYGCWGLRGRAK